MSTMVQTGGCQCGAVPRPGYHFGIESRIPWFDIDDGLPRKRTDELSGMKELWARATDAQA